MKVEVRCCCDPGKLLGWIELKVPALREGDVFKFPLSDAPRSTEELVLGVARFQQPMEQGPEALSLPVAHFTVYQPARGFGFFGALLGDTRYLERGLALKSNDAPIETLRRIPGFVEAP